MPLSTGIGAGSALTVLFCAYACWLGRELLACVECRTGLITGRAALDLTRQNLT